MSDCTASVIADTTTDARGAYISLTIFPDSTPCDVTLTVTGVDADCVLVDGLPNHPTVIADSGTVTADFWFDCLPSVPPSVAPIEAPDCKEGRFLFCHKDEACCSEKC